MLDYKSVVSYEKALRFVVDDIKDRYLGGSLDIRPTYGYVEMISFIYSKSLIEVEDDVEKLYRQTKMSMS